MRPVKKWAVGDIVTIDNDAVGIEAAYRPYGKALPILTTNIGGYCSYCEVYIADIQVEHIVSKLQDRSKIFDWDNFLLSHARCNGSDNKGSKPVDINTTYLPHLDNTFLAFEYLEGGIVQVNATLAVDEKQKAENLLDLVGLDKYPGNPKYPKSTKYPNGFPSGDKRWEERRKAWTKANLKLKEYEQGRLTAVKIAEFAKERGFFSIWFTVFAVHKDVKEALVKAFRGTNPDCFDADFRPVAIQRQ